jgi:hypothetical protein
MYSFVFNNNIIFVITKNVLFRAEHSVTRRVSNQFEKFFNLPSTPLTILSLNPAFEKLSNEPGSNIYTGYLAPIQFPGVSMRPVVDFIVEYDTSSLTVTCIEGGMRQSFEGNEFFANLLSKLIPDVRSCNKFKFEKSTSELSNIAWLEIELDLPSWFPIPAEPVQKRGSAVIQKNIETDLNALIDKVLKKFEQFEETEERLAVCENPFDSVD